MKQFIAIAFTLFFLGLSVYHCILDYTFDRDIGDWLKLAAEAPSIERADEFLNNALLKIEERGLTSGHSAFAFFRPSNDVAIWYSQIQGAKQTTSTIIRRFKIDSLTVTQSEQGIALMKIREVLVDESSHVIKPTKIVIFPYQWLFLVLYVLFFVLGGVFWIGFYQDQ